MGGRFRSESVVGGVKETVVVMFLPGHEVIFGRKRILDDRETQTKSESRGTLKKNGRDG